MPPSAHHSSCAPETREKHCAAREVTMPAPTRVETPRKILRREWGDIRLGSKSASSARNWTDTTAIKDHPRRLHELSER